MDQMTGRSRGFAFVVFKDVDTLTAVLSQDHAIKGKKVAVKKAASKGAASKQGKIYIGKFKDQLIEARTVNPKTFVSLPSIRRNQQMLCSKRVPLLSKDKKWRLRKLPSNPTAAWV